MKMKGSLLESPKDGDSSSISKLDSFYQKIHHKTAILMVSAIKGLIYLLLLSCDL